MLIIKPSKKKSDKNELDYDFEPTQRLCTELFVKAEQMRFFKNEGA